MYFPLTINTTIDIRENESYLVFILPLFVHIFNPKIRSIRAVFWYNEWDYNGMKVGL